MKTEQITIDVQTGEINREFIDSIPEPQIELTEDEKRALYEKEASRLIRQRYSLEEELALHRQREIKMEDFQEYFDYCEECKTIAREALEIPASSDPTDPTVQYKLNELTETINILIDNEE